MDKYEEALEKARAEYEKARKQGYTWLMGLLEGMFPDLKESEDERIRRHLIDIVETYWGTTNDPGKAADLAWLEKRKEQKLAERSLEDDHIIGFVYDLLNEIEWKDSWAMSKDECLRLLSNYSPQKPAEWSEEDEDMRLEAIRVLVSGCERYRKESGCLPGWHKVISWLKSLHPQPKAELTLLDENIIKAAVAFVEQNDHFNSWGGIDKHTVIKALRSLKPHWKPSKEQIYILDWVANILLNHDGIVEEEVSKKLQSLSNDLQKLL